MSKTLNGAVTLAIFVLAAFAAGAIGMWFPASLTANAWIAPSFAPPAWVFGPVWSTLYSLMALSIYWLVTSPVHNNKPMAIALFTLQMVLNAMWTPVFFGAASLSGAMVILAAMWLAVLFYILVTWRINKFASSIMLPYLAWLSLAGSLNFAYLVLN